MGTVKITFKVIWLLLVVSTICPGYGIAQEKSIDAGSSSQNKLTLSISHTHVPGGINDFGDKVWLALPSWGLDYDRSISKRWGLGIHTDLVIQDFSYEEEEGIIRKRTKPLATALVASYKATPHFTLIAGGGGEFAPEGTLSLIRIGTDYGWELPKKWELTISVMADFKINAYNAWVLGIGVSKIF